MAFKNVFKDPFTNSMNGSFTGKSRDPSRTECSDNLQADGTVKIPEVLWPYMGGTKVLVPKK